MNPRFLQRLLLLAALLSLLPAFSGCASRKKAPLAEAASGRVHTGPQRIGTVSTVRESLGFALIDAVANVTPGLKLQTVDPKTQQETATLTISPQLSPPFFLGDITSGKPSAGDWVVLPGQNHFLGGGAAQTHHNLPPSIPVTPTSSGPSHVPSGIPEALPPIPDLEPLPNLEPIPDLPPL